MAAYVAVARLKNVAVLWIKYLGMAYPPLCLEIMEFVIKELNYIQECIERLDVSSRMRMRASLQQIPELITEYKEELERPEGRDEDELLYFKQQSHSYMERLKKLVDDVEYQNDHPFPISSRPKMVGLSDEFSQLKLHLVIEEEFNFHNSSLYFISLVGMAGIGKTTLAKEIFQDLDMLEWFDCQAWVTVGKIYQPEENFQSILAQVLDLDAHEMPTGGFQEIAEYLKESLKDKRYLIILDDVWDMKQVQDYFESSLPDNEIGSRVLLTSRIQPQANDDSFVNHPLRLLNNEESWHLLRDKVFVEDTCPPELEIAGKKIAEKCDGLPLTIITVANLLSKAEKTESFWIEVVDRKRHQLFIDAYKEISKVLYPSYDNLSEDLKLCFLYLGVFPQNSKIPKSKLINLWIAEKIIKKGSFETLEVSGVECLEYLSLHSVIMVYKRSTLCNPTERVKTCGLHASWWHFCYEEAKENKFFHVLDSYSDASREVMKNQSRLTIYNNILFGIKDVCKSMEENCASTTHSLLCLGPYHQYEVPVCFSLLLLQKLDALNIRFYEFPLEILELVKLRYLALTCNANLPSSISKLGKLRYLIVHRHLNIKCFGLPSYLPIEIWDLTKLKHLYVIGSDVPDGGDSSSLPNFLTLSGVSLNSCTIGVIKRIPNLKKLGIQIQLMPNMIETLNRFDPISDLSELESLKCVVVNPICKFEVIAPVIPLPIFPLNLKKLYLNGLGYPWREMTKISSLPNLQVLKLRCNAFQGPKWEIEVDEFSKLRSLLIEDIDLVELKGASESFECLQKVSIKHCYNMKWLYLRKESISKIEIVDCNLMVQKRIQESSIKSTLPPRHFSFNYSWNS